MRPRFALLVSLLTLCGAALLAPAPLAADYKDDIGYTALVARLGASTPSGTGVIVTQVEASDSSPDANTFLPDPAALPPGQIILTQSGGVAPDAGAGGLIQDDLPRLQ